MVTPSPLARAVRAPIGVSLPGLIAASARLNVLGDVKSTLRAIGVPVPLPGGISLIIAGREEALAARLDCPVSAVAQASTPYIGATEDRIIRWGNGALFRSDMETRRRRVSPGALEKSPHHRQAWMNRLLDYCPESLERLVDACPHCSRPLKWLAAWGIGHCDDPECGPLAPSGELLPDALSHDYRSFCALVSPVPGEHEAFVASLKPLLRTLHPVALGDLALKLGAALNRLPVRGHDGVRALPSVDKARVAATGAALLKNWPEGLRSAVADLIDSPGGRSGEARRRLRADLIKGATPLRGDDQVKTLLRSALPEIFVEVGKAFGGLSRDTILASPAALLLGISHAELARSASDGLFTEESVHENIHRRAQYRKAEIEAAAVAWRGSAPVEAMSRALGLPRYASELVVAAGDVSREAHPFALRLPGQPRVVSISLADYLADLQSLGSTGSPPSGTVTLLAGLRMVGGRLKPWREVLAAIRAGELSYWLSSGTRPLVARMHVHPGDLVHFARLKAQERCVSVGRVSPAMSQIDAISVLNLGQVDGPRLVSAGALTFSKGRGSLLAPMADVLALARLHVAPAEAAARLRLTPQTTRHRIDRVLGPASDVAGWPRNRFDEFFGPL